MGCDGPGALERADLCRRISVQYKETKKKKAEVMSHMDQRELQRINCKMTDIKIPKMERHHSLLRGLSHGERCYMFSIISVYDPAPARRRLYNKHKVLCKKALGVNIAEKHHFTDI